MTLPHFAIAGTQKGGTTWLEHQLAQHPGVFTPRRQLHFFDVNYGRGLDWYRAQFAKAAPGQILGEKTTEYFDTEHGDLVPRRIAESLPGLKTIVILRNPVRRATSALQHKVNSGLEPLPRDPNEILFADMDRPPERRWRYVERGFYDRQLDAFYRHLDPADVLVLIFEEDIVADPESCWARVCDFIGVDHVPARTLGQPVNRVRLSPAAIHLSRLFFNVPYARGAIRRADGFLGLTPWQPRFSEATLARLRTLYAPHNEALFEMLRRRIPAWEGA